MKKICFDRILPRHLAIPRMVVSWGNSRFRAIAPKSSVWPNGSTITIAFLGGSSTEQAMVREIASEWMQYANLKFDWRASLPATIRIAFDESDGAWSYIGTDNLEIPSPAPTLNLGWLDKSVILHEVGHMLGEAHEHQNPLGGIHWNEEAVIADLSGPPNYWDVNTIRFNVLEKYDSDQIYGTEFDPLSIMLYSFPPTWTVNGWSAPWNEVISEKDKAFVHSQSMYPFGTAPIDYPELPVFVPIGAEISTPGEHDTYKLKIKERGLYTIETTGSTDMFLTLYDSSMKMLAQDDDSGAGTNSKLKVILQPGDFFLQARHFYSTKVGKYNISVVKS